MEDNLELFFILRGFASLSIPSSLSFPIRLPLSTVHSFLLNNILLNPHFQVYPPSDQYQKQFWKLAIHNLENNPPSKVDEDFEIDERIYEHYLALLPPSGPTPGSSQPSVRSQTCGRGLPLAQLPPSQSYITHYWKPSKWTASAVKTKSMVTTGKYHAVTLLESRTTIESGTTGLRTWMASFALAHYLISHPELVKNRRILELGSGIGFLGIIVASLQKLLASSSEVWLTDVNDEVLARCRDNVNLPCNLSSSHSKIRYRHLDWFASLDEEQATPLASLLHEEIDADLILGADLVFNPSLIPALVRVLSLALQPGKGGRPKVALMALTVRNQDTIGQFLNHIQKECLKFEDIAVDCDQTTFTETIESNHARDDMRIFRITI